MKQRLLILAAASTVLFAACGSGDTEGSYTQEQLDSITSAKTDSAANAIKAENDSIIAAQAAEEARRVDSIRVADSLLDAGKKAGAAASVAKKTTAPKPKPPVNTAPKEEPKVVEPVKSAQKEKFDSRQNNSNTISEEKKQEQKSKFDSRK